MDNCRGEWFEQLLAQKSLLRIANHGGPSISPLFQDAITNYYRYNYRTLQGHLWPCVRAEIA